jgi:hypothetical protein
MTFGADCGYCGMPVTSNVSQEAANRRLENHERMSHPELSGLGRIVSADIRAAANALADARVRYAQEYARIRLLNPEWTDKRCLLAATEETNDEVTRLEAELEIARRTT